MFYSLWLALWWRVGLPRLFGLLLFLNKWIKVAQEAPDQLLHPDNSVGVVSTVGHKMATKILGCQEENGEILYCRFKTILFCPQTVVCGRWGAESSREQNQCFFWTKMLKHEKNNKYFTVFCIDQTYIYLATKCATVLVQFHRLTTRWRQRF